MEAFDDKISIGRGFGRTRINGIPNTGTWTEGDIVTPNGIVSVYAEGDLNGDDFTRLDFAYQGFLYIRNFHGKRYTQRGLTLKAKQFAKEVVEKSL